jgi:hypothetical protein
VTEPTERARKPLGILERRQIEAEVIKPIYADLQAELGTERAQDLLRRAMHAASKQGVKEFAPANAPAYAHPCRVFTLDSLPLGGTNKVDRRAQEHKVVLRCRA